MPGQLGLGAEPVVRQDPGLAGVCRLPGGSAVRYDDHTRRTAEGKAFQTRLVLHRVLRQRRFLLQRVPLQNPGKGSRRHSGKGVLVALMSR